MSAAARRALWERLREHVLVEGDMPEQSAASVPWYVRAILGIAGWIGAVCLLAFVGITLSDVMRGTIAPLVIGSLCCTAAHAVFRAGKDNDFANQFGLALSMAGQGLFMLGIMVG